MLKKKIFYFFVFSIFPILCFGQESKWIFYFKTNLFKIEIEEDVVDLDFAKVLGFGYNIHRNSTPVFGGNFGMKRKFKIMNNFYLLTGFDLRISQVGIQEWLEISYGESNYYPNWEMETVTLDGKIDRGRLDMASHKNAINPFPENEPNNFKEYFTFLDIPFNIHFESRSKKWFSSTGFTFGISLESLAYSPSTFSHENFFLGVNTDFSYKIIDNWFITIGYTGFHEGVFPSREVFFNSRNQNIFSFGLSCLIKP